MERDEHSTGEMGAGALARLVPLGCTLVARHIRQKTLEGGTV